MNGLYYINISMDIFCALACLIILIIIGTSEYAREKLGRIFIWAIITNMVLLLSDVAVCALQGSADSRAHLPMRVFCAVVAACGPVLLILLTVYVLNFIRQKTALSKIAVYTAYLAIFTSAADIACIVATQFNGMYFTVNESNILVRQDWFMLSQAFSFACMGLNTGIILAYRRALSRRELFMLLSYPVIPAVAVCVHILVEGLSIIYYSVTLTILFFFEGIRSELTERVRQRETELAESRIALMLSQIQPHFLHNSLTAIAQLCDDDPAKAKSATIDFSIYLRNNMDSLSAGGLIPFQKELEHIEVYLNIEKAIYGKALDFCPDIETTDFMLPPLTVQPIVENAVKHGIGRREGGGTVSLSVRETDGEFLVTVSDDGMGYDALEPARDGKAHVGIDNVRQRLLTQCGGSLRLTSRPRAGTTAEIRIPKGARVK